MRLKANDLFTTSGPHENLAAQSIRGGFSILAAKSIQFILSTGGTVVLARLLLPADFGLIGMVAVITGLAAMFKDAGLSMATIQKEKITNEQISTLFWINLGITAILGLLITLAAPLAASFYKRPELTAVTVSLALAFAINGLVLQHQALLRRHLRFGALAAIQILAQATQLLTSILLALLGFGYWALVGGLFAQAAASVISTFFYCPWIPGKARRGTGVREMLRFGGHLTAFNFANYFSRNLDRLLIGRHFGAEALGLYSKAYQLFMMPVTQIRNPINQVLMPVLSRLKNDPDRFRKYYRRMVEVMALLAMPLTVYCFIEADFLIMILLGERWLEAVPVFRILALAALIQPVAGTRGLVLLSLGRSRRYMHWGFFNALLITVSFFAGLPFGITGVAGAYTAANYLILIPSLYFTFRDTPIRVSLFLGGLWHSLINSLLAGLIIVTWLKVLHLNYLFLHLCGLFVFSSAYSLLSWRRREIKETMRLVFRELVLIIDRKNNGANG